MCEMCEIGNEMEKRGEMGLVKRSSLLNLNEIDIVVSGKSKIGIRCKCCSDRLVISSTSRFNHIALLKLFQRV